MYFPFAFGPSFLGHLAVTFFAGVIFVPSKLIKKLRNK